jgi:phosphoribosyl 1,2-cyclic phosphodiesterase
MASVVVDDVLALDAGSLTSSLSFLRQKRLRAVLLTHQHYDHVRDLPALAMNFFLGRASLDVYATPPVFETLKSSLFGGDLYPDFFEPREGRRVLSFNRIDPYEEVRIGDYSVLPVPVVHAVPTVGFQVKGRYGETVFYTGDTGPGLRETWRHVSPHVLIVELTVSDRLGSSARESGHLSPSLLKSELTVFKGLKGYLPRVVAVHMDPDLESQIARETEAVASDLGADIALGHEGMVLDVTAP